jgi:nucleoside-diphosphate-sugar epimerase
LARILITGAAGFIGRASCYGLVARGHTVGGRSRGPAEPIPGAELLPIGDIGRHTDWTGHLDGAEVVIHLATRAHRLVSKAATIAEPAAADRLARAAAGIGVRRLLFMSSIRAMGKASLPGAPFRAGDKPQPRDDYGRGKLAIENALRTAAQETGIELVILRPPLVYGPGVTANFQKLIRLVAGGVPLPFGSIENRRSLIFLDNLVDLIERASFHPAAAGQVLLARDTCDLSTPELIRALAAGLGRPARLFAVPPAAFAALRPLPILGPAIARLTLSLQVDDTETHDVLDWRPPVPTETALAVTARDFRERSQ